MSGILFKRRDVFQKQWRPRYFVLNPITGMFTYYILPSSYAPKSNRQRLHSADTLTSQASQKKQPKHHAKTRLKNGSPRKRKHVRLEASVNASHERAAIINANLTNGGTFSNTPLLSQIPTAAPGGPPNASAGSSDESSQEPSPDFAQLGLPRGSIFLPGCHVYPNDEKTKTLQARYDLRRDTPDRKSKRRAGRQRLASADSAGGSSFIENDLCADDDDEKYPFTYVLTIAVIPPGQAPNSSAGSHTSNAAPPPSSVTPFAGQHLAAKTMRDRDLWVNALRAVSNWMDLQNKSSLTNSSAEPSASTNHSRSLNTSQDSVPNFQTQASDEDTVSGDLDDSDDDEDLDPQSEEMEQDEELDHDDHDMHQTADSVSAREITPAEAFQKFYTNFVDHSIPPYLLGVPKDLQAIIDCKVEQLLAITGHGIVGEGFKATEWKLISKTPSMTAKMKPSQENDKLYTVRCDAQMPSHLSIGQLVNGLLNGAQWTSRTKPDLTRSAVIHHYNAHTFVMHEAVRPVWPTTARDYLLVVHWRLIPQTKQVVICGFSHPMDHLCPPQDTHVRADILLGGNVLTPSKDGGVLFQRVVTMDLKGTIPSTILQVVMKNQANFPMALADALTKYEPQPSLRLQRELGCNEDVLAHIIWHIPKLRKGALSLTSHQLQTKQSSHENESRKGSVSFMVRLQSYFPVLTVLLFSLGIVYYLVFMALPFPFTSDPTEGKKRVCACWVLWVFFMSCSAGKCPSFNGDALQCLLRSVQVRSARIAVPMLMLLPPLIWFLMRFFAFYHGHWLWSSLSAAQQDEWNRVVGWSVRHELLLCAFASWYITRLLASRRLKLPASNIKMTPTGLVTCRFQVDVKGALRFISQQKEELQLHNQKKARTFGAGNTGDVSSDSASSEAKIVIGHIVVKAVALALSEVPECNLEYVDIPWLSLRGALRQSSVNIDMTTGFDRKLAGSRFVTLANAHLQSVRQIAQQTKIKVDQQKAIRLQPQRSISKQVRQGWLEQFMDWGLQRLGWSSEPRGAALVITSPNAEHADVEIEVAPATSLGGAPIVVVVGGVRITRDVKTGASRPMISLSLKMDCPTANPASCRRLAERIQQLISFPELCDVTDDTEMNQ